jgi:ADP-L-glycero-D-manno-heptose 6-epimerase
LENKIIVVTGAYGFIASCFIRFLNEKGANNIVAVDDFSKNAKAKNLSQAQVSARIERVVFPEWFEQNAEKVGFVFHLGARTDTTEFDYSLHETLNVAYSKLLFNTCIKHSIPIVYASSAATYGLGEWGYGDQDPSLSFRLKPLNAYGVSKNEFDKWVLSSAFANAEEANSIFWAGLKFFNVYGPNEYHKGRMASTIWHFYNQIQRDGTVKLFKSHRSDYGDGAQMRDFVYVKDVLSVLWFLFESRDLVRSGLYNLGTGTARTFNSLVTAVFDNLNLAPQITYIDTPEDIRDKYQYYTEANMEKLRSQGYKQPFFSLEEGIEDYVQNYLLSQNYY